jgi:hypothetical protein
MLYETAKYHKGSESMKELIEKAQEFLETNNISLTVMESGEYDYGLAHYNPVNKTIVLSIKAIKDKAEQWNISPDDYILLVMAHEIGHYYDTEGEIINNSLEQISDEFGLEEEEKIWRLIKQRELNAWENGMRYIPSHLENDYKIMNLINLEYRYCSTKISLMAAKHNKEKIKLTEKLAELSRELKTVRTKNIELMEENFNLRFGKDEFSEI